MTPTEALGHAIDAMGRDEGKLNDDDLVIEWVAVVAIQSADAPGTAYLTLMSGDLPRHHALGLADLAPDLLETHYDNEGDA